MKASEDELIVPLSFKAGVDGDFTINIETNTVNTIGDVFLEDQFTNEKINLSEQDSYTFQSTTSDESDRFLIYFNGVTSIEEIMWEKSPEVIYSYGQLSISHEDEMEGNVFIYTVTGQLIKAVQLNNERNKIIDINTNTGIYLIRIYSKNNQWTKKIHIY
ncbi:MAG: T9SS type A sorting domain-containing protein [Bacteroidales bacterium]|nr:T9SS type A sorting domain-containing protein [Bacteroidales bacterium]